MSTNPKARAWVQVEADALRRNYARIGEAVGPDVRILPMVKANAYGLGVAEAVVRLESLNPWGFGVATVSEGSALRDLGVERPIIVCSPAPLAEIGAAVAADLQLSVSSLETLTALAEAAAADGRVASWHLDIDTGMGRSGFDWRRADEWLDVAICDRPMLSWAGVYTHLHSADESASSVHEQWARLEGVLQRVDAPPAGLLVHVLNSAGAFRAPEYARSVVRPGIFLYGGGVGEEQPAPEPVASVHARVVHLRDAEPGTTLGYGSTYTATADERWATLSIGYGDGLPRALSNRGAALVEGTRVPIVGRISMDVTVVNVSGVSEVREGSVATLIGSQNDERIALDEVAEQAGTISYEILTGLTSRLPRVWA
jgi:alanine racemase